MVQQDSSCEGEIKLVHKGEETAARIEEGPRREQSAEEANEARASATG